MSLRLGGISIAQKMNISIKDFLSKFDKIRSKLRICSHLVKKSLMENFILMQRSVNQIEH